MGLRQTVAYDMKCRRLWQGNNKSMSNPFAISRPTFRLETVLTYPQTPAH